MASSTRDHQSGGGRSERERGGTTTGSSNRRRSPSVPERMCATPIDERDLAPSQSNYAGRYPSRSPERERSSNNQGETARSSDRERSHNQGNSSATERSDRASRRNTGEVSYISLENGSRETLPPPYATLPPPGENRIPIVLRRQDTNLPPYATTAPSRTENRIPIVPRRPHSSPLLPNADPRPPWQRNRASPMARQYTLPVRPHTRPDSRNHNIRTPEFIPYANQRGNPNFEPARLSQFEHVLTSPRTASKVPETVTDSSDASNAANAANASNAFNSANTSNIANIPDVASTPAFTNVLRLVILVQ